MKKRMTILLLFLCLILPAMAVETDATTVATGSCGDNVTWTLDDGGTLTISGEGDMEDYTSYLDVPWGSYRGTIINVIFEDTIKKIGNNTFENHYTLQYVDLPDQLQILGEYCFNGCNQLKALEIPASLLIWKDYAVCANVKHVRFLGGVPGFGENALYGLNGSTINYPSNDSSWDKCIKDSTSYGGYNLTWVRTVPNSLANGRCGVNAYWCISMDGVITFSPTYGSGGMIGYMNDYGTPESVPWAAFKNKIYAAVCEEGITHIGKNALYACTNLQSVTIPKTVAYVRDYALAHCYKLQTMTFPGNAPVFGSNTFANTVATVYYPVNDATWTNVVGYNYGGTIVWETYCPSHNYGIPSFVWNGDEACTATFVCAICGDSQILDCRVTAQTIPATEQKEGKTLWTAAVTFNGRTYTDAKEKTIPKLEHIHSCSDTWCFDKTNHWKQCSACGEKKDISTHVPGDKATENKSQKCTICGHILRTPLGLDWFFEKIGNSSFHPSGFYTKIMEQYADFG